MAHPSSAGTSTSWISPTATNFARFSRLQTTASYLGLTSSPFFPRNATEFNTHNAAYASDRKKAQRRILECRIEERKIRRQSGAPIALRTKGLMGGRKFEDKSADLRSRAGVLLNGLVEELANEDSSVENDFRCCYSTVLGEKTSVWQGDEGVLPEGKRLSNSGASRAYWPEASELKVEGEKRMREHGYRRLPLPRMDCYSDHMVIHLVSNRETLSHLERQQIAQVLAEKTGDDIAWFEREIVEFEHPLDRLKSIDRERAEYERVVHGDAKTAQGYAGKMNGGQDTNVGSGQQRFTEFDFGHPHDSRGLGYSNYGDLSGRQAEYGILSDVGLGYNDGHGMLGPPGFDMEHTSRYGSPPSDQHHFAYPQPDTEGYVGFGGGDGDVCPLDGWKFDENILREDFEWNRLFDEIDCKS